MKVVIATPLYPPEIGGPATYAKILEDGLPARGIEVEVVKFSDVRNLPNAIRHVSYFFNILSRARRADVILALDALSVGWPVYFANIFLRKRLFVKIVGDHIWEQGRQSYGITGTLDAFPRFSWRWHPYLWFLRALQFRVAQSADAVIVPSDYLKGIVMRWGIPAEKITRIYNAVPLPAPGTLPPEVKRLTEPYAVSVGRLVPWKHFDAVIDAVAMLRAKGQRLALVIIGVGPLHEKLSSYAAEKLGAHALMLGMLAHENALAVVERAVASVLDSSYEGLSHVLVESLMLGVPIVASDIPGNREVVAHERDGLLVTEGDTQALAAAIERLASDAELANRLSFAARESAKRFSTEAMLQETATLLANL